MLKFLILVPKKYEKYMKFIQLRDSAIFSFYIDVICYIYFLFFKVYAVLAMFGF